LQRATSVSGFFHRAIDKRITCPYKFSKRAGVKDSGRKIWADLFTPLQALLQQVAVIVPVAR
jgi:hypothetical protein